MAVDGANAEVDAVGTDFISSSLSFSSLSAWKLKRNFDGALGAECLKPGKVEVRELELVGAVNPFVAPVDPVVGDVLRLLPPFNSSEGSITSEGRIYEVEFTAGTERPAPVVPSDITSSGISSTVTLGDAERPFMNGTAVLESNTEVRCFLGGEGSSSSGTLSPSTVRTRLDLVWPLIPFVVAAESGDTKRALRRGTCNSGNIDVEIDGASSLVVSKSGGGRDRLLP